MANGPPVQIGSPSPTDYTGNVYYFFFKDWLRQPFGNNYISSRIFQRVETDLNPSPKPYSAFLGTCGIRCARIPHLHRKVPPASNRLWSSPPPERGISYKNPSFFGTVLRTALQVFLEYPPSLARIPTLYFNLGTPSGMGSVILRTRFARSPLRGD